MLRALKREHVDCTFCQRIPGLATALSTIFMNSRGDRTIVTYCDKRIAATTPTDADAAVAVAEVLLALLTRDEARRIAVNVARPGDSSCRCSNIIRPPAPGLSPCIARA